MASRRSPIALAAVVLAALAGCGPGPKPGAPQGSFTPATFTLRIADREETVTGAAVTAQFFAADRVTPLLGRGFLEGEYAGDGGGVAILSHRLWADRFQSSPSVIGERLVVDGRPRTIVGVTPEAFQPEQAGLIWIPRAP
jgi:hypothetical protein